MTTIDPVTGETVRGFQVLVFQNPHPRSVFLYPKPGLPFLTGEKALELMRLTKEMGFESQAHTESYGVVETITLAHMEQLFDLEKYPNT